MIQSAKVLCVLPNQGDATSFYRALGPLGALRKQIPGLQLIVPETPPDWQHMAQADVVFLQRPANSEHLRIADLAKTCGVPLWVDYDDNLLAVPVENPAFDMYAQPETQHVIRYVLGLADRVTVTTDFLKDQWRGYNKNITVIPNAWPDHLKNGNPAERQKLVLWRGSHSHLRDMYEVENGIIEAMRQSPDWKIIFVGMKPYRIIESLPGQASAAPMLRLTSYFDKIRNWHPSLVIVPLHDSSFNRSKSNIAWLEGNYAGANVLAPKWDPWLNADAKYPSPEMFHVEQLRMMKHSQTEQGLEDWGLSHHCIQSNYLLSSVNDLRHELLTELIS